MEDNAATSTPERLLITDDLHSLKEGEIYTNPENGKKYRVHKSMLPGRSTEGPHGVGDPNDRTLRKIEADVVIPKRMNDRLEKVECKPLYLDLVECFKREGAAVGLKSCKDTLSVFNRCKWEKFHDTAFREMVTNDYINERADYRRYGMTEKERKLEEYREWKRRQDGVKS